MKEKIEYHDGHIVAMAGASPNHHLISFNIASELHQALKGNDCYIYNSDQQLLDTKSTGVYDKAGKFQLYQKIPSFKAYLLIHADRIFVESYYWETANPWHISSPYKLDDYIHLHSIKYQSPIKRYIYINCRNKRRFIYLIFSYLFFRFFHFRNPFF